jgi:hypothetical protein
MKNYILLVLSILFYSCTDQGEVKKYDYTIINNSGVTVELIPYDREYNINIQNKKTLLNGEKINQKLDVYPPYNGRLGMSSLIWDPYLLTKVDIVFNNTKKVNYTVCNSAFAPEITNCDEPRNIFREEYNQEYTEVYIITPEDYENAIPCDGDCN